MSHSGGFDQGQTGSAASSENGGSPSQLSKLKSARSIQEFWIDFLLEEEFAANPEFIGEFLMKCDWLRENPRIVDVAHSVGDKYGEADLIVIFEQGHGEKSSREALLIEDKINAAFQPKQAERYQQRGLDGINAGRWTAFHTVLVAPQAYVSNTHGFDKSVTLEAICDLICPDNVSRRKFRVRRVLGV